MHHNLKVLAVTSLPTVGNAGLKNMISILGNDVIPLPTLIACGLGNMAGHKKVTFPFEEVLVNSLELAKNNHQRLIVYTGYLLNVKQIDCITENLTLYRDIIETIIVDPVCGDNGKAYVDASIINHFYRLIKIADVVTPNETELGLLTNSLGAPFKELIKKFEKQFTEKKLIVTSVRDKENNYNAWIYNKKITLLPFQGSDISYAGTGDMFVALFIKFRFFNILSVEESIAEATITMSFLVQKNIELNTQPYNFLTRPLTQFTRMKKGTLFYVVGPSGVGKDTLLNLAEQSLKNSNVSFPKRYITRSKKASGEDHIPISQEEFISKIEESFFSLSWKSHGNYYGISNHIDTLLSDGLNVVVNGSRGYHDEALRKYPEMKTIFITASENTIRERLIHRGRETHEQIEKRIERSSSFSSFLQKENIITMCNESSLEVSSRELIAILSK